MKIEINRKVVTDPFNFVWIPTGHFLGVPSGMTGMWDGETDSKGQPLVTFPDGRVAVSKYATFYEPTEAEIDDAIEGRGKHSQELERSRGLYETRS